MRAGFPLILFYLEMPSKKNTLTSFTNLQGASNYVKVAREIIVYA